MEKQLKEMQAEIELLRNHLHNIADQFGITSAETLCASQRLDLKLNEYFRNQTTYLKTNCHQQKKSL